LPGDTALGVRASDRQAIEERRGVVFESRGVFGSGLRSFTNFTFPLFDGEGRVGAVRGFGADTSERRRREEALAAASLAASSAQRDRVFQELTRYLATILNVHFALVGRITDQQPPTLRTLGIYGAGGYGENFEYPLDITPCRDVVSDGFSVVPQGGQQSGADAGERVEDPVSCIGQREHAAFHEFNGELAGVDRLLGMIGFDIGNVPKPFFPFLSDQLPDVGRILAEWVARRLAILLALEMRLAGILGRHTHTVEIECVCVSLGEP
jgi:hypothetical protein